MTQSQALDILKMGHNVFLTGPAGSGKTYVLNKYLKYLKDNNVNVAITASTGIAATHLNGLTIHAWSGLGIKDELTEPLIKDIKKTPRYANRLKNVKVLVIDEISMLHSYRLDMIDLLLKSVRQSARPFGGVQLILSGDFFQLPPVNRHNELSDEFAYNASSWQSSINVVCYLEEQYRQSEDGLIDILNEIRNGNVGETSLNFLRERYHANFTDNIKPTRLHTHNHSVDSVNDIELSKIKRSSKTFIMTGRGPRPLVKAIKSGCLAPETLKLKIGATVMFVRNNFEQGYVNGTLGAVTDWTIDGFPIVTTTTGLNLEVKAETWGIDIEGETRASISQLPLRLAWAITIHKSQGMTLDAAEVDLSRSFTPGMGYVALSRVKALSGLRLLGFNEIALKINPAVVAFDQIARLESQKAVRALSRLSPEELKSRQDKFLLSIMPTPAAKKEKQEKKIRQNPGQTYEETLKLLNNKHHFKDIAERRGLAFGTVISHAEKIISAGKSLDLSHISMPKTKLNEIRAAFQKKGIDKLSPVHKHLKAKYSFNDIRLARLLLRSEIAAQKNQFSEQSPLL